MNSFKDTVEYVFNMAPDYQKYGVSALNYSLGKMLALSDVLGNPHEKLKFIHVAGTNGKGSVCHLVASVLQEAGYKTGLYTSPHLFSFTERIRLNGNEIEEEFVVDFVSKHKSKFEQFRPSFFELTTLMAFDYFNNRAAEIVVLETGLGGRLDATNIVEPLVAAITNIGYDHMNVLGDTLTKIATEKAGIIKQNKPVVIGEYGQEAQEVFVNTATLLNSKLLNTWDNYKLIDENWPNEVLVLNKHSEVIKFKPALTANYQKRNHLTALSILDVVKNEYGFTFDEVSLCRGFENVIHNTGLKGRWQKIHNGPDIILDTAHNYDGLKQVVSQACNYLPSSEINWILAFSNDKDYEKYFEFLPLDSNYFFCDTQSKRLEKANVLLEKFKIRGYKASSFPNIEEAILFCKKVEWRKKMTVITGSNFHISEIPITQLTI